MGLVRGAGVTQARSHVGAATRRGRGRRHVKVARVHSGLRKGGVMAIVVLVLWLFTAGAGFYLLVTSNLARARTAATTPAAEPATAPAESATVPAAAAGSAAQPAPEVPPASKREMR